MTTNLILTFLILIHLNSCKTNPNGTLITGKIIGELPTEIIYTNPINGVCDLNFSQSVITDSLGNFNINLDIENPVFIKLFGKNSSTYQESEPIIIAEPGEKYELIIDLNKKEHPYFIKGEKEKIQHFYNDLSRINPRSCMYSFDREITDMAGLRADLNEQKQKEISAINNLYENGEITEQVYSLIKSDRKVYYGIALGSLASLNNVQFMREKIDVPELVFEIWEEANSFMSLENQNILKTTNIYHYLYLKLWYHIYTKIEYDNFVETRADFREKDKGQTFTLSIADELFENEILEFFKAQYIISNSRKIRKKEEDKEFIEIIEEFKISYPNSQYIKALELAKKRF